MSGFDAEGSSPLVPEPPPLTLAGATWQFDESGPALIGIESSDDAGGAGASTGLDVRDPVAIYQILTDLDPDLAELFARDVERWQAQRDAPHSSFDVEFPRGEGAHDGPSTPSARAGKIDVPQLPQAVATTPERPRAPEHRAQQPPEAAGAVPKPHPTTPLVPRPDINQQRSRERHEALQREVDRVDPAGDPSLDLETRVQQLPARKRQEVEGFLTREWLRSEEERRSTLVWGRNGRIWTRGDEERDQAREVFEQGLERASAASGSLGGALLMSAGAMAGVTDHQTLMNLAEMGSTFEDAAEARAARGSGGRKVASQARTPKTRTNGGSKDAKGKRPAKSSRSGMRPRKPIRINPEIAKDLELTPDEIKILERVAEVFREEMADREKMGNQTLASVEAHKATQSRIAKEFGDKVIIEPGTGVSAPGHKLGDIQVYGPSGDGLMIELKRTTYVRSDNTLVTKGMDAKEPGQASQTDAFEVLHHQLGTPVIVLNSQGNLFGCAKMYDVETGGGWMQVGGPSG